LSAANADTNAYSNKHTDTHEHLHADCNNDADVHENTDIYRYTNVYANIHGDTHINQHRDARARALGQFHRDCGGVFNHLCPQQCG